MIFRLLTLTTMLLITACNDSSRSSTENTPTQATAVTQVPLKHIAYSTYETFIDVVDGPNDDHAVTLDTTFYIPDTATSSTPQPVIVVAHGFGNQKSSNEVVSSADYFARNGYIVFTYSAQGFGKSSGCIRLNSFEYDVKNVIQIMDNVFDNPDVQVNGVKLYPLIERDDLGAKVGMIGGSYGGGIALNVASVDKRVRAIVPGRTWNSLQYSLIPNNLVPPDAANPLEHQVDLQGVFKSEWTSLFFASGNAQPAQGNGGCPQEKMASGEATEVAGMACTGFPLALCETFAAISASGNARPQDLSIVRNSSVATKIHQLDAPTMLVQGMPDTLFNPNDATATYLALQQAGVPVSMIWNSAAHGSYFSQAGECEVYGGALTEVEDACYLPNRALNWFARWLREDTSIDTGPGFAWFRDWLPYDDSGSAASQYGQSQTFPPQTMRRFYLSASDELVSSAADITVGNTTLINPPGGVPASYSERSNFTSPEASPSFNQLPPNDPPGQAVSFTSSPFEQAVESVGIPRAHLNLTNSNGQDLVFFGKVFDVAPDGTTTLIHRLIAPVRVPAAQVGQAIDIHLIGFAHRFEAGHRVRLMLASTDTTSYNAKVADSITVFTGGADPAYFELPTGN